MLNTATVKADQSVLKRLGTIVEGVPQTIGSGFTARHFSEDMFAGRMDPLVMVDHFVMTAPTFDPHLHAGISAVTALFEDSTGDFLNRDTLGHTIALKAGDLYWLAAASGAAHEEKPAAGARIHALQIFVNLPDRLKRDPARALHVPAREVPVIEAQGHRARVVLGRSGDTTGATGTPEEMSLLDGALTGNGSFTHPLPAGRHAWIYAVAGQLTVRVKGEQCVLTAGSATTVSAGDKVEITLESGISSHFVLMAAKPIREPFVKAGPLVMRTKDDVRQTLAEYAEGKFGRIPE